nr:hypothetical protein [Tanacetum cinerariifolium]
YFNPIQEERDEAVKVLTQLVADNGAEHQLAEMVNSLQTNVTPIRADIVRTLRKALRQPERRGRGQHRGGARRIRARRSAGRWPRSAASLLYGQFRARPAGAGFRRRRGLHWRCQPGLCGPASPVWRPARDRYR